MKLTTSLGLAVSLVLAIGGVAAAPVHSDDANVSSWDVGNNQVNGHFSVTTDDAFGSGGIQLGLRAEQRRVGAVTPTFADLYTLDGYEVMAGLDPGTANRAWWNFQLSIGYGSSTSGASISDLDALTLSIQQLAGTNSAPTPPGVYDLKALRATIDDRNCAGNPPTPCTPHTPDPVYNDVYQVSQNPVFGWFTPPYGLDPHATFAYRFTLTALENDVVVRSSMCVATAGLSCTAPADVPEPSILALLGLGLALLAFIARRRKS